MNRIAAAAVVGVLALGLAGCGSGSSRSSGHASASSSTTSSSATSPTSTSAARSSGSTSSGVSASTTSPAPSGGEAAKPPRQILADAATALRASRGYLMAGTVDQNGQQLQFRLATTSATSIDMAISAGGATAEMIAVPSGSFIRANGAFWDAHGGGPLAARLAGRWIQVPSQSGRSITSSLGPFAPATLSRCLVEDHGTLSTAGTATIGGQRAIELRDAGDAPGSSPGVMAIAASGPPYPLRYTATGGQRAGGRIDVCNDGKASDAHGTVTFSRFGHVPAIQAPRGALSLGGPTA